MDHIEQPEILPDTRVALDKEIYQRGRQTVKRPDKRRQLSSQEILMVDEDSREAILLMLAEAVEIKIQRPGDEDMQVEFEWLVTEYKQNELKI